MIDSPEKLIENKNIKLLDGFSIEERLELLSFGTVEEFYLNDQIISELQDDMNIYIVLDGEVSLWRKNIPILRLKQGDIFNEKKIFSPNAPNKLTIVAERRTKVMKIGRKEFLNFFSLKPERLFKVFVLNIIAILSHKSEEYEEKLVGVYFQTFSSPRGG